MVYPVYPNKDAKLSGPTVGSLGHTSSYGYVAADLSDIWSLSEIAKYRKLNQWPRSNYRGIWAGGLVSAGNRVDTMDYVSLSSLGDASDFGNLSASRYNAGMGGSGTRAITMGGIASYPAEVNIIEYVEIGTLGNMTDFGNMTETRGSLECAGNHIRQLSFGGGDNSIGYNAEIDYITIASTGNGTDFGDLTQACGQPTAFANPVRAIRAGGIISANDDQNVMDFITIASAGDAVDFGDLLSPGNYRNGCSSHIAGFLVSGNVAGTGSSQIDRVTFASLGNSVLFGDMATLVGGPGGATSSSTKGFLGAVNVSGAVNSIEFFDLHHAGVGADFGDLTQARYSGFATSNGHGGLGVSTSLPGQGG